MILRLILVWCIGFLLSCSNSSGGGTPTGYVTPQPPKPKPIENEADTVVYDPRVDILFVVDNSGSMSSYQQSLAANINQFLAEFFRNNVLEYQIGVITTDNPQLAGFPSIIDKSTPTPEIFLGRNLQVGTNGSPTEAVFDPTIAALTPPYSDTNNKGFFRDGAYLAVIFITDAEDQSSRIKNPDEFFARLLNLKQGDREKLLLYGVIIPVKTAYPSCSRDGGTGPVNIERALSLSVTAPDNIMEICSPDYGTKLAALSQKLINQIAREVRLIRAPAMGTIEVTFGTQTIPEGYLDGWSYVSERNSIVLGPNIAWTPQVKGTRLKVKYVPLEF